MSYIENIKKRNKNWSFIVGLIFVVLTGGLNFYSYFRLPERIASQFSIGGSAVNTMPKDIYLASSFLLVVLLTILFLAAEKENKIKFLFANAIVVLANAIVIIIQL